MFGIKYVPELIETGPGVFTYALMDAKSRASRPRIVVLGTVGIWAFVGFLLGTIYLLSHWANPPMIELPNGDEGLAIACAGLVGFTAIVLPLASIWATNEVDVQLRQHRRHIWLLGFRVWTTTINVRDGDEIVLFFQTHSGVSAHNGYISRGGVYRYLANYQTLSNHPDADMLVLYDRVGNLLGISNRGYGTDWEHFRAMWSWFPFR